MLNASDSIMAKDNFERMAQDVGVSVDSYHTDNGIFKSRKYVEALRKQDQTIRYSGVGAKWQNGAAEGAIRIVVSKARTMMIHAALHWPDAEDPALWPMALTHAAYLYNHTPNPQTGQSPMEIFTQTVSDGLALRNTHTWGCPAYVLEPKLTEAGGKIPKWQPRSRRGQFLGVSPLHAESVGLILNRKSGYVSPQYHVVYDDWFETVYADGEDPPPEWEHLCTFQRFEIHFDEEAPPPLLTDDWLTPQEAEANRQKRRSQTYQQGRRMWQEVGSRETREDFNYEAPPSATPS